MSLSDAQAKRWVTEAERLHRRYQIEVVEAYGLCPWAVRSRVDETQTTRVLLQSDLSLEPTLDAMKELAKTDAEVALFLYPRCRASRSEFERFVAKIREEDARRYEVGQIPHALAAFHPDATPDRQTPERLIPFLRRSPDPSIQLIASAVLDRIKGTAPQGTQFVDVTKIDANFSMPEHVPLRERIARANMESVEKAGLDVVTAKMDAIIRDRDETYRALERE